MCQDCGNAVYLAGCDDVPIVNPSCASRQLRDQTAERTADVMRILGYGKPAQQITHGNRSLLRRQGRFCQVRIAHHREKLPDDLSADPQFLPSQPMGDQRGDGLTVKGRRRTRRVDQDVCI